MSNRTVNTRHSEIFEYWRDKAITKDGDVVLEKDCNFKGTIPVVYDWGEPECWACGRSVKDVYEYKSYDSILKTDLKEIWNMAKVREKLNKCHIVPHAYGGKDEPQNLFLLCEACHCESPDTINPKNFLKWVYKRRMKEKSVNGYVISEIYRDFITDCEEKGKDPHTIKLDKAVMCQHGGRVSQSTVGMALADTCDDIK